MDNRHDLIVDCHVTQATGTGERDGAKDMAADLSGAHQKTIGADKNYDTTGFVAEMRWLGVTPHVAQNTARSGGSAIDGRTTRHGGYAKSINARRGIEKVFGWLKAFGGLTPVQTARPRERPCRFWPARERLHPDPPGQPAQARDGGGMNSLLPRGVPKREQPMPCRQANVAEIELFADLMGVDSAF
jgi:hypothetical protein